MTVESTAALKTFQSRLTERLREASAGADSAARLGLMIGEQRWLVDLSEAGEIVPVPDAIAPVPLTRDWLIGLVNLRGALFTVIDLQRFAGAARTEPGKDSRLLALAARLNFNAAILVTRMLGLRNVAAMQVEEPAGADATAAATAAARDRPAWIGRTLVDADGQRWYELDLAALAASPAFLMVGR